MSKISVDTLTIKLNNDEKICIYSKIRIHSNHLTLNYIICSTVVLKLHFHILSNKWNSYFQSLPYSVSLWQSILFQLHRKSKSYSEEIISLQLALLEASNFTTTASTCYNSKTLAEWPGFEQTFNIPFGMNAQWEMSPFYCHITGR